MTLAKALRSASECSCSLATLEPAAAAERSEGRVAGPDGLVGGGLSDALE